MLNTDYEHYDSESLSLRDRLALDRTELANERTLLSYVRTMAGLIAVGGTLFHFSTHWVTGLAAVMLLASGFIVFLSGYSLHVKTAQNLQKLKPHSEASLSKPSKLYSWIFSNH